MKRPLVLLLVMTVVAQADTPRRYCGRRLTSALQLLCNGLYNPVEVSVTSSTLTTVMVENTRSRRQAYTIQSRIFRHRRQGVYDECCRKSCTVAELSSYCGIP